MNQPISKRLWGRRRFPAAIWYMGSCVAGSLLFMLFQGGKLAVMLFLIVTVLSVYLLLGNWSGIRQVQGGRRVASAEQEVYLDAGQSVPVCLSFQLPGLWPVPYMVVKDRLRRQSGEEIVFEGSLVPDWKRRGEWQYSTPPLRRGLYHFGETECMTEDIFGFFQHKGRLDLQQQIIVYPQTAVIQEWVQLHQMLKGMLHHSTTTLAHRETTQINGVREYIYGDRLSRIHWAATAKTGTWKSKEFERESLPKTIVLLDCAAASYGSAAEFELAVSAAASLFRYGSSRELALGLLSAGKETVYFDPRLGGQQHKLIMNHLVGVEADGAHSVLQVVQDRIRQLPPGTFFVLISPQKGTAMLQALQTVRHYQMNPCHIWIHPGGRGSADAAAGREDWIKSIRGKGHTGYEIAKLDDLPSQLGGTKRYA